MNKALMVVVAWILGIGIAVAFGFVKYANARVITEAPLTWGMKPSSPVILIPLIIAGFMAGAVMMAGVKSRLASLALALIAVLVGMMIGDYIGFYCLTTEAEKLAISRLYTHSFGTVFAASIFDLFVFAFVPAVIGVVIGKKVFRPK